MEQGKELKNTGDPSIDEPEKEFNLSDKIKDTSFNNMGFQDNAIEVKDIKEFIKRLKHANGQL